MKIDRMLDKSGFAILLCAILLHLLWGLALLVAPTQLMTTPLAYFIRGFGQQRAGTLLLAVAALGLWGVYRPGWQGLFLGSWQNITLWVSASSGIISIIRGHYADGVIRSAWFISSDQLPIILFALLHTCALALYHGRKHHLTTAM